MVSSHPKTKSHEPVLREEVLRFLNPKPGDVVVDATVGSAGHAAAILKCLGRRGRLVGIDQDPEAVRRAQRKLKEFKGAQVVQSNFNHLDKILERLNLDAVDAVLLDVGLSTEQLEAAGRGFSFLKEGPLDMRMNPEGPLRARDLVNDLSQGELEKLLRAHGEGRWAGRIARAILRRRARQPIETTRELAEVIEEAVPRRFHFGRLHPATRTFQALRIRVNDELRALEETLPKALRVLRPGGRIAVISFHSLEDRIVKQCFREGARQGILEILTKKPVEAGPEEVERNPRSRSAKLRVARKAALPGE